MVFFAVIVLGFVLSCKKDIATSDVYIKKQWKADLSVSNVIPAISGRTDHAVATIYLMDNNELHYYVYFDTPLNNNDVPGKAAIYIGAAGANGNLFINLDDSAFNGKRELDGKVILSRESINTLLAQTDLYLNVTSNQQSAGLVRGQIK